MHEPFLNSLHCAGHRLLCVRPPGRILADSGEGYSSETECKKDIELVKDYGRASEELAFTHYFFLDSMKEDLCLV